MAEAFYTLVAPFASLSGCVNQYGYRVFHVALHLQSYTETTDQEICTSMIIYTIARTE